MGARFLLLLAAGGAWFFSAGQGAAVSRFDVVSIKPSLATNTNKTFRLTPDGGFIAGNYSLKDLIRLGWDVRNFQILGGAGWLDTERYNVQAKSDAPFNPLSAEGEIRQRAMVQGMLQDRFQLRAGNGDERLFPGCGAGDFEAESDG